MKIVGLQKLSLVDFDGHMAATVFTSGCNFACSFCHNSGLIPFNNETIKEEDVYDFLNKRKGILDSVCISGGEPTLHPDLPQFISKIKGMGYLVKLDTNGTNLSMLKHLVENKLVDYIAMDVKNTIQKYNDITQVSVNEQNIKDTIKYIMNCGIEYEFRTTLIEEYHKINDIIQIGKLIKNANKYFLQKFVNSENCLTHNLNEVPKDIALQMQCELKKYIKNTYLRGY